jgi:hypothetical protein
MAGNPVRSGQFPEPTWTRARYRALADGLPNISQLIVTLLDTYGTGKIRATAWPAHELAAGVRDRIDAALASLEGRGAHAVTPAAVRQLLADLHLDRLADHFEASPADGVMQHKTYTYRCPAAIWDRADARRPADGFRDMTKLVLALVTRYAAGGITLH